MTELQDAISWWEQDLTSEERNKLLTKSWSEIGDVVKRHEFLLSLYRTKDRNYLS